MFIFYSIKVSWGHLGVISCGKFCSCYPMRIFYVFSSTGMWCYGRSQFLLLPSGRTTYTPWALSLSPIHKLNFFIVTRKLFRLLFWTTNASQTQKKGAKVLFCPQTAKPIQISVSFKWQNANSVDKINLPSEATLLPISKAICAQPNWNKRRFLIG